MEKYSYRHPFPFELENGQVLDHLQLAFHSSVAPENIAEECRRRKVVWICHALTANSDPSDWWEVLVGPGKYFDTDRDLVICVNTLGSCYGSTGPSNWEGRPLDFPRFSVRDIVRGNILVRKYLQVEHIDLLIGGSVGGFQSLEWTVMEPEIIGRLVLIACNARFSAWATAFNESQRMAIRADQSFAAQESLKGGEKGLQAARSIALLSYRSHSGYVATQSETDPDCFQADRAASYQRYQGKKLSDRFDAYSYYYMTLMLDTHNVGRGRGGVKKVLNGISTRTLIIYIDSDVLFPKEELIGMAAEFPNAELRKIVSRFGHDGFLLEWQSIGTLLKEFEKE